MKSDKEIKTICYFGICDMSYSRNKVFSDALKKKGMRIIECTTKETGFRRYFDLYKKHKKIKYIYDVMIVGFPGFIIAPFARLVSRKKVILDALSSRYDSDIVSRNAHEGNWFKKAKILCIDWLAFASSHLVLVETEAQKEFMSKKFGINKKKIAVAYTGVDETLFKKDEMIQKHPVFTVLFRGRIMSEAGVPVILKAAKLLESEDINFEIIGYGWGPWIEESGKLYQDLDHSKVSWTEKELPFKELVERCQKCHVSLGQFGNSERIDRTIPHKAFEAMVLEIPFITSRSVAIEEITRGQEIFSLIERNDSEALARAILRLKHDRDLYNMLVDNASNVYREYYSSDVIGKSLIVSVHRASGL